MFICKRVPHLRDWKARHVSQTGSIGFVPTMGALHQGHLSLIRACREQCDHTIVSVFVNPRQFNDPADLVKYPRPVEQDIRLVSESDADVLFMPDEPDMYPADDPFEMAFDPGSLGEVMEGKFRPGHFRGVADVVYRLLKMVEPQYLFLGQKDFQQVAVVRKLVADLQLPVQVIACPTVREGNGLAMSSRNLRLSEKGKADAARIFEELIRGKKAFQDHLPVQQIKRGAMQVFLDMNFEPEYFEVVDGDTLQPIEDGSSARLVVACCAVKVEGVRLIDNVIWKGE